MQEDAISEMLNKMGESVEKASKKGFVDNSKIAANLFEETKQASQPPKQTDFRIILLLILMVNISVILLFLFDAGQVRTRLTTAYNNKVQEAEMTAIREQVALEREVLETEKKKLEEEKNELLERQSELAQKEAEQDVVKQETASSSPAVESAGGADNVPQTSEEETAKLQAAVKIYEQMDAKSAAKIITSLDLENKVRIIRTMKKDKAAEILSAMDSEQSSSIMQEMLKNSPE